MSPPQPPPPSYPSTSLAPKLPSYSLEELQNLPGANLKKSSVDLNVYIAAMARNTHPEFANIDNFAERCLACIVRKIKTNLPTLRALMDSSARGDDVPDPGCVLIPRMKDGRITIARPGVGGAAGGTKKIHPHLALVQIFRNPGVTNHNHLVSLGHCAAPFFARAGEAEGDMVCINPLHYVIDNGKMRSPALTKRKSNIGSQLSSSNILLGQMKAEETRQKKDYPALIKSKTSPGITGSGAKRQSAQSVESDDFLSDSDDDGIDWAKRWDEERVVVEKSDVQEFNVDEIVREIKFMSVETNEEGLEETKETEQKVLEKLRIIEDYKNLLNGKYDLSQLKNLHKVKPRSNKHIKTQQTVPQRKKPGPKPKKKLGETWISGGQSHSSGQLATQGSSVTSSKIKAAVNQVVTNRMIAENKIEPPIVKEEEKDATVIQDLLEDIKGSFDNQFDMDMDSFGGAEASSDFGIGSEFNLGALEGFSDSNPGILDKNMSSAPGSSDAMFGGPSEPLNIPQYIPSQPWPQTPSDQEDKSKESVSIGSSLMEDLSSLDLSLPRVSQDFYNPQPGGSADQFPMDQPEQRFPDPSFLPSGTISQDQFFNIFDE